MEVSPAASQGLDNSHRQEVKLLLVSIVSPIISKYLLTLTNLLNYRKLHCQLGLAPTYFYMVVDGSVCFSGFLNGFIIVVDLDYEITPFNPALVALCGKSLRASAHFMHLIRTQTLILTNR